MRKILLFYGAIFYITSYLQSDPGAGTFFYRHRNNDVEFLFCYDPHQKQTGPRFGFEYPGGTIDDHAIDQHLSKQKLVNTHPLFWTYGALREGLEETVFVPATDFCKTNPSLFNNLYTKNGYDQNSENQILHTLYAAMKKQGIFFLFKPKPTPASTIHDGMAVFFLDVTAISDDQLLNNIITTRYNLAKQTSYSGLHAKFSAEPVAFAWVSGTELLHSIQQTQSGIPDWVTYTEYKEDQHAATSTVHDHKNKKILLSKTCMGMMRSRINDPSNPQPDMVQVIMNQSYFSYDNHKCLGKTDLNAFTHQLTLSSSMMIVIPFLQKNTLQRLQLSLTAPASNPTKADITPPPTAPTKNHHTMVKNALKLAKKLK